MAGKGMTPREAAAALIAAMPTGVSESHLEEYGIGATAERAQALTRELLSLNLFWIFAAIEAHIPQKYQSAVSELVLHTVETGWGTIYPVGPAAWTGFLTEWKERRQRFERLVLDGISSLALSAEVGLLLEEQHVVGEEDRRNVLTLLIDSVPVETYGQLLEDVG
jgi:hypothetical protein